MAGEDIFINLVALRAFRFVERELQVTRTEMVSRRRHPPLVRARALFVAIMQRHTAFSYPEIGRLLGNRDHTTIMHLAREVGPRLHERDADFVALCEQFDPKEPQACTQ